MMTRDPYLLHEHLEEFNEPLYFHQFAGRAAAHGLQYLGEAQGSAMVASRFGPEIERTLRAISPDLLHMEQYMDFLRNRMFRQTLLCHADLKPNHALKGEAVSGFYIASGAKAGSENPDVISAAPEEFKGEGALTLTTRDPLMKAAMLHLIGRWPESVPFASLLAAARERLRPAAPAATDEEARTLAAPLLHLYTSKLVEVSVSPAQCVCAVSDRPLAS